MGLLGEMTVRFGADVKGLISGIGTAKAEVSGFGSTAGALAGAAGAAFIAIGAAAVGAGVQATKMAGDFQESMTQLVTGAGESEKNIKLVSDGILAMATTTGTSTKQLAAGMYMIESAGFHGKAGLDVLKVAAMGAKVGAADLGTVADATTTILKDFGNTGITASGAVNTLIATVAAGKTHMQDLSRALSQILPTASAAHVGLNDVMGAMATMTGEGVPAAQAATYLRQTLIGLDAPGAAAAKALKSVGLTTTEVATEMQKSLPQTLAMITEAVGKKFPEGSAGYVEAIKAISGGSKTMQGMLDLTGQHLQDFKDNVLGVAGAVKGGGNAITGWTNVQQDFNFKISQAKEVVETLMIRIGTALLPVLSKLFDIVTPLISKFSDWITKADPLGKIINQVGQAFQSVFAPAVKQAHQAMAPLMDAFDRASGIIHSTTVAAKPLTDAFDRARGIIASTTVTAKPFLDSFDRATGVFTKTATGAHGVVAEVNPFIPIFQTIGTIVKDAVNVWQWLSEAWKKVVSVAQSFQPVLQAIGDFMVSTFQPVWQQLVDTFNNQLKPAWNDFMKALVPAMPALQFIGVVIGTVIVVALISFIEILALALRAVIGFVGMMVKGALEVGTMFVQALSMLTNTINGIVAIFQWLYNELIGHSLIPDLINGISTWFGKLVTMGVSFGINFVNNILNGLKSAWNNVTTWFQQALAWIAGLFPHSPVEHGPLKGIESWGKNITDQLSRSIRSGMPTVQGAFGSLGLTSVGGSMSSSIAGSGSAGSAGSSGSHQVTHVHIHIGTRELVEEIGPDIRAHIYAKLGRRAG